MPIFSILHDDSGVILRQLKLQKMIIMKKRFQIKFLLILSIGLFTLAASSQEYKDSTHIPALAEDPASHFFGTRLQRTLTLLASSTENQARKIRILFYGQSIVAGLDAEAMVDQLRKYYPLPGSSLRTGP